MKAYDFDNTNVTDADLAYLKGLSQLMELGFHNTNIGDAGLEHLEAIMEVYLLELSDTGSATLG